MPKETGYSSTMRNKKSAKSGSTKTYGALNRKANTKYHGAMSPKKK